MKVTNKKFDNIFCVIMIIAFVGFGAYIGGLGGVFDTIIIFIQETFKVLLCLAILAILCIFFPKIKTFFDKADKN